MQAQEQLKDRKYLENFQAEDYQGKKVDLYKILWKSPVVLTFYRGHWSSECISYLSNLQDSLNLIKKQGAVIIAITPEKNKYIKQTVAKTNASFMIIYDKDHKIMDYFNVSYQISGLKNAFYKLGGVNINKYSDNYDRILPVTATYLIGIKRRIIKGHFNKDPQKRMSVKVIVETLKKYNEIIKDID